MTRMTDPVDDALRQLKSCSWAPDSYNPVLEEKLMNEFNRHRSARRRPRMGTWATAVGAVLVAGGAFAFAGGYKLIEPLLVREHVRIVDGRVFNASGDSFGVGGANHPYNVTGDSLLRVLEDGRVLLVVCHELPTERRGRLFSHRVIHLVPEKPDDSNVLPPDYAGRAQTRYDRATRTIEVRLLDAQMMFRFSVEDLLGGERVTVEPDGTPIVCGIQISSHDFSQEFVSNLSEGFTEPLDVLAVVLNEFERRTNQPEGDNPDPLCNNCQAGGPGATQCNIGDCSGGSSECGVTCGSGYYACCKCVTQIGASCKCCKNDPNAP